MTLNQLRALVAAARAGSIQEAARLMHVTQPALSKAIRDLERELGVPLLIRSARGVTLTPYGVVVERRARAIRTEVDNIIEEINWIRGELSGRLIVGLAPAAATPALAKATATFRQQNPQVELQLLEMRSPQIVEGLRDGMLDLGIITQFGTPSGLGFKWKELFGLEMILAAGGEVAKDDSVTMQPMSLSTLSGYEWLELDTADELDGYLKTLFEFYGLPLPQRIVRCSSTSLGYALASRLNVVTCWARRSFEEIEPRFSSGRMVRLTTDNPLPDLIVSVAYRDEDLLTPAARNFVRLLQSSVSAEEAECD